eukprot:Gb_19589 [translate_table: standard]
MSEEGAFGSSSCKEGPPGISASSGQVSTGHGFWHRWASSGACRQVVSIALYSLIVPSAAQFTQVESAGGKARPRRRTYSQIALGAQTVLYFLVLSISFCGLSPTQPRLMQYPTLALPKMPSTYAVHHMKVI